MLARSPKEFFELALQRFHADETPAAEQLCREALAAWPDDVDLLTLHGVVLLASRQAAAAQKPLQQAVRLAPGFVRARENLGQALLQQGALAEAVDHLQHAAALDPGSESVRLKLAHALAGMGDADSADRMYEQAFALSPHRGELAQAAEHLRQEQPQECQQTCLRVLSSAPDDVNALRLLAKAAGEQGRWVRAERLLRRVLVLAADFHDARLDLARALKQQDRVDDAVACTAQTTKLSPRNPFAWYMHASMLAVAVRHDEALQAYHKAIELRAYHPAAYVGLGHLLKTLGRQSEGVAAYRKAIEQRPNFGEVYWSLANLKTFRFTDDEVRSMQQRLETESLDEDARIHFMFALGKACEDRHEFDRAFEWYEQACAKQRLRVSYDPVDTEVINERIQKVFTPAFIAEREGVPDAQPRPIFIVGMPRSGSTLIEQILASHSQVEGTAELPDIGRVIGSLAGRHGSETYPEVVRHLDRAELHRLGQDYLQRSGRHRRGQPLFTDKMPNNFPSIGLIHLILPNALIIDARRHPLDSCFGSFKQHFAHGQSWSYDLLELGEYYLQYRQMMRHWQQVLPGKVLEMKYEDLVQDQEAQTRRLLQHCGLRWEPACLRFYETERAVRTASSEQVRQPIYTSSLNHWRHYRRQLAPLADLLGDELDGWDR